MNRLDDNLKRLLDHKYRRSSYDLAHELMILDDMWYAGISAQDTARILNYLGIPSARVHELIELYWS